MQIFALDDADTRITASSASRSKNYFCLECQGIVRLRGGIHRQLHFYHLNPTLHCRQNGKTPTHLAIQIAIQQMLPPGEAFLEERFPLIKRIADIAWPAQKLIFEIQCSPILAEEVAGRTADYASIGYQVVWILHDRRFNRYRLSAAEQFLKHFPHYYTNFTGRKSGIIYDQYAYDVQGRREYKSRPLPIHLRLFSPDQHISDGLAALSRTAEWIEERLNYWQISFEGDLFHRLSLGGLPASFFLKRSPLELPLWQRCKKGALLPYRLILAFMLDKTSS